MNARRKTRTPLVSIEHLYTPYGNVIIGQNIRRLRMRQGRTLEEVAEEMQEQSGLVWRTTTQSDIECGIRSLSVYEVIPLLRAMGYEDDAETHISEVFTTQTEDEFIELSIKSSRALRDIEWNWHIFQKARERMQTILDSGDLDPLDSDWTKCVLAIAECEGLDRSMSDLAQAIASCPYIAQIIDKDQT